MRKVIFPILATLVLLLGFAVAPAHAASGTTTSSPALTVSASSAPQGNSVTVYGTGFMPNFLALLEVTEPDGTVGEEQVVTDAAGSFTATVPLSTSDGTGTETISAFDYLSSTWASAVVTATSQLSANVPYRPGSGTLTLSSSSVALSNMITITGSGFTASSGVYVSWTAPDGTQETSVVETDASGDFVLRIPALASHGTGTEAIYAIDSASQTTTPVDLVTVTAS